MATIQELKAKFRANNYRTDIDLTTGTPGPREATPSAPAAPTLQPTDEATTSQPKRRITDRVVDFIGARPIADTFGATIAKLTASPEEQRFIDQPSVKETVGSAIETSSLLIPGGGGS